ncbi:hypothetical protein B0T21DRAFT_290917 [Apiosordaria backusii]|uniref:Protein prenyltransferase n=1 Tax=Apiosordaria backusii TaxID=314023 RepID=A0AA40BE94_9PEZI|nr:hypothetical protein B0T21DRAFT_290917 [Apiosordaria backusii]
MSRAIDPDTAAKLKSYNLKPVYEEVVQALSLPTEGLLEIEILKEFHFPEGHNVLKDGHAIAVSKLGLVQAFLVAKSRLEWWRMERFLRSDDEMFDVTFVILLFDPEHLTAANTRKVIVQEQLETDKMDPRKILEREKRAVDSLLTSRLHRHTKSPVLWSHRRWVISQYATYHLPVDVLGDIKSAVCVAGERHPRNYYAWCHARFLVNNDTINNNIDRGKLLEVVETWCALNHTDISGWSFLSFLLDFNKDVPEAQAQNSGVIANVLGRVDALRLSNESVWVFLRTLAGAGAMTDEAYAWFREIQKGLLETETTPAEGKAVLRKAVEWCETYRGRN